MNKQNLSSSLVAVKKPKVFNGALKQAFVIFGHNFLMIAVISIFVVCSRELVYWILNGQLAIYLAKSGDYSNWQASLILILEVVIDFCILLISLRLIAGLISQTVLEVGDKVTFKTIWQSGKTKVFKFLIQWISLVFFIFWFAIIIFPLGSFMSAGSNGIVAFLADWFELSVNSSNLIFISGGILLAMMAWFFCSLPFLMIGFANVLSAESKKLSKLAKGHFWSLLFRTLAMTIFVFLSLVIVIGLIHLISNKIPGIIDQFFILIVAILSLIYFSVIYQRLRASSVDLLPWRPRFYKIRASLALILFIILGGILLIITDLNKVAVDLPIVNDQDLEFSTQQTIPVEQNAYYVIYDEFINKGQDEFYKIYQDPATSTQDLKEIQEMASGINWNKSKAQKYLKEGSVYLERFNKATELDRFQDPNTLVFDPWAKVTPLSSLRVMLRLQSLKVEGLLQDNQYREALAENYKLLKFSQMLLSEDGHTLIQYLVGMVVAKTDYANSAVPSYGAWPNLNRIVVKANFNVDQLRKIQKKLDDFSNINNGFLNSMKRESYLGRKYGIEQLAKSSGFNDFGYYFQPNRCSDGFANNTRELISISNGNWQNYTNYTNKPIASKFDFNHWYYPKTIFRRNLFCDYFTGLFPVWIFESTFEKKLNLDWQIVAIKINIASLIYQKEKGAWPENLETLAPDYITQLPVDPFSGQAIKYSKEKHLIYSVGKNLQDNAGQEDDLVFQLTQAK